MARRLRNVTVTLDDETARWARIQAAREDTSVSGLLGEILRREMGQRAAYDVAMGRFFAQAPGVHRAPGVSLPSRDELHERPRLR